MVSWCGCPQQRSVSLPWSLVVTTDRRRWLALTGGRTVATGARERTRGLPFDFSVDSDGGGGGRIGVGRVGCRTGLAAMVVMVVVVLVGRTKLLGSGMMSCFSPRTNNW